MIDVGRFLEEHTEESHLASGMSWGKTELADRDSGNLLIDRFRTLRNSALNFRLTHLIASSTPPTKICSSWNAPHHRKYSQRSTGGSGYFFGIFLTPFPVLPFLNASASPAGSALKIYPKSFNYQQLYHHSSCQVPITSENHCSSLLTGLPCSAYASI